MMNIFQIMKSKRPLQKASEVKVLEGESEKLREKLTSLKEQIKQKKQEKEMSKTTQSVYSNLPADKQRSTKSTMQDRKEESSLAKALFGLKMEHLAPILQEKNVTTTSQLMRTKEEVIDSWKNIPVGYRIKLKKFIEKERERQLQKKEKETPQTKEDMKYDSRDIEEIIKERKTQQVFVPLLRENEEAGEENIETNMQEQLQEQEQQKMMLSLFQAFGSQPRKSCLKKTKAVKKMVRWSQQVDQMEKRQHTATKYPKETISKNVWRNTEVDKASSADFSLSATQHNTEERGRQENTALFCWSCLSKIKQEVYSCSARVFCSEKCFTAYQSQVLLQKVEQQLNSASLNPLKTIDNPKVEQELEQIDLSLE